MSLDALLTLLFVVVFVVLPLVSRVLRERNARGGGTARPGSGPTGGEGAGPQGGGGTTGGAGEVPPWLAEAQRRVREARGGAEASTAQPPRARPPAGQPSARPSAGGGPQPGGGGGTLVPEDPFRPVAPAGQPGRGPVRPAAERSRTLVPEEPFGAPLEPPGRGTLVPEDPFERGLVGPEDARRAGPGLGREGAPPPPVGAGRADSDVPPATGRRRGPATSAAATERAMERGVAAAAYGRPRRGAGRARLGPVGSLRFEREAVVTGLIWHEILDEPAWKRRRGRALSRRRSR